MSRESLLLRVFSRQSVKLSTFRRICFPHTSDCKNFLTIRSLSTGSVTCPIPSLDHHADIKIHLAFLTVLTQALPATGESNFLYNPSSDFPCLYVHFHGRNFTMSLCVCKLLLLHPSTPYHYIHFPNFTRDLCPSFVCPHPLLLLLSSLVCSFTSLRTLTHDDEHGPGHYHK